MSSKLEEANEWISKAEKSLKTSLFKRTPDYDSAIEYYTKAALLFRSAKQLDRSAQIYEKVGELQLKNGSFFHAAKNYETASTLYRELKEFLRMAELITNAGELLRKCGAPDSASYLYEKAAKSLEQALPERSAQFYELAAESAEIEEKYHMAADQCNNAARVWVRMRRFADAERVLRSYIDMTEKGNPDSVGATMAGLADSTAVPKICARAVLALILIKLHQGDEVAAGKIYSEAVQRWRFSETDENPSVRRLLAAIDQQDGAAAAQAIKEPCFRSLDLDYARLAKEIKLPKVIDKPTEPAVNLDNQPSSQAGETSALGDDEFDDEEHEDIC